MKTIYGISKNEVEKCEYDINYFIEKYINLHDDHNNIDPNFGLFDSQTKIINSLNRNKVLIAKSRLTGVSSLLLAYALHSILFNEGQSVFVVVPSICNFHSDRVINMYNGLPFFLKLRRMHSDGKNTLYLQNDSFIQVIDQNKFNRIEHAMADAIYIFDEYNHMDVEKSIEHMHVKQLILSATPPLNTKMQTLWTSSRLGYSPFYSLIVNWKDTPLITEKRREKMNSVLGRKIASCECCDDLI